MSKYSNQLNSENTKSKWRSILMVVFGLCGLLYSSCFWQSGDVDSSPSATEKPNILFLFTDDHRRNSVGAYGIESVSTPHIDQLVRSGTSFTNSYILGATTAAVCSPSRAMLMTGRHYFNIEPNVYAQFAFPPAEKGKSDLTTFPEHFKANGYKTFATGKQHNGRDWVERGFDHVRSVFLGGMTTHFGTKVKDYSVDTGWSKPYRDTLKYSSQVFADAAIDFISEDIDEDPFLMYVSFTAPHDPRTAPSEYHAQYTPSDITVPSNFMSEHPFMIADYKIRDEVLAPFPRTEEIIQKEIADYYAMISATDHQIGRILKALEKSGKADNTIIVFSGDNGLAVGQHGLLGKQNVYEHSVGVPLVFAGPGIPKNKRVASLAYLHDVFPTLCGLTSIDIPSTVQTEDLTAVIKGNQETVRQSMMYAYNSWPGDLLPEKRKSHNPGGGHRAVRKGNYKLIVSSKNDIVTHQLFDVINDQWELNDLSNDDKYENLEKELLAELKQLMSEAGDQADLNKPEFGLFDNVEAYRFK